ncbi:MAG: hypothetical protein CMF59_04990 [Leptospiraceae bacterium]|nr:hypothetical protein [Leptospiraceae bacterium]
MADFSSIQGSLLPVSRDRQIKMIDTGAKAMQRMLAMGRDDALEIITRALVAELEDRATKLDAVLISSKAEQTVFLRGVVGKVEKQLRERSEFNEDLVRRGIQEVMRLWHETWSL